MFEKEKAQLDHNRKRVFNYYDRNNPSYNQRLLGTMYKIASQNPRRSNWDILEEAVNSMNEDSKEDEADDAG